MSGICRAFALCLVLVVASGCVESPLVVQGTVTAYDPQANTVTVRDERAPNAELVLALAGAEIGGAPTVGDQVRVAYRDQDGARQTIRLMNLTRQEELAKGRSKGH
jgi:hypothetical protein